VSGVFLEWYDPPEYSVMPRLWAPLLWDPDLYVAAEIADLCRRLYGPAGDTMTASYRLLIQRYEMPWGNPELVWDQFHLTPDLYFGRSLPPGQIEQLAALLGKARREVGLPAVLEAKVQHGSAVHLFNAEDADVPVGIGVTALEHELVNPGVGWEGGRIVWRGRLQPGERLDIAGAGRARMTAADGSLRDVGGDLEGEAPKLAAGRSDVFHFWHAGPERGARFEAELQYGPDGDSRPEPAKLSTHARRLAWVRDPYPVFRPTVGIDFRRGLFAEAHGVHRHLGHVPAYQAVRVDALPTDIDDPLWRDVPAAELVRGREDGGPSYERNGLPPTGARGCRRRSRNWKRSKRGRGRPTNSSLPRRQPAACGRMPAVWPEPGRRTKRRSSIPHPTSSTCARTSGCASPTATWRRGTTPGP
jgi:hypothetical protein